MNCKSISQNLENIFSKIENLFAWIAVSQLYTDQWVPIQWKWCPIINLTPEFFWLAKVFPKIFKCICQNSKMYLSELHWSMSSNSVKVMSDHQSDPCCSSSPCTTTRNSPHSHLLCLCLPKYQPQWGPLNIILILEARTDLTSTRNSLHFLCLPKYQTPHPRAQNRPHPWKTTALIYLFRIYAGRRTRWEGSLWSGL